MVQIAVSDLCILLFAALFDFKDLKKTSGKKTWVVYLSILVLGAILVSIYVTLFHIPPSPLLILQKWMEPWTGWLSE